MRRYILPLILCLFAVSVSAAPLAQANIFEQALFDARADLEVLADAVFGLGIRPQEWTGNTNLQSETVASDLWFDNELLANGVFGAQIRPETWIGVSVPVPEIIVRNVRHDLELAADAQLGLAIRPPEWRGGAPITRCDRTLQNTLTILNVFYGVQTQTPESAINYCAAVSAEVEDDLINIVFGTPDANGNLPNPIDLLSAVRGDLERLADELLGLNTRPEGYIASRDVQSPTFVGDILLDMNLLADQQLGIGIRPPGWISGTVTSPASTYLILRRNLELLADATLGVNVRPTGWQGVNPLERCEPTLRSLTFLVESAYEITLGELDPADPAYCTTLSSTVNALVENPPQLDFAEEQENQRLMASSNYAFSYLDYAALDYMGVMPGGTQFRAVYRNYGESNMMFVSGADFAVYVDWRFTTLAETTFRSLPTIDGEPLAYCDANWCNGPGPTPTPTGFGPLIGVLIQTTPFATPNPQDVAATKQLVSWNYVRVGYVFDNLQSRTAQVTLELCAQAAAVATACEPVVQVFDNNINANLPVLSVYNGLNVYEFRYGYTTNLLIEGSTRYSTDVWIADPTIR
ncbi:MAG: hypothetical protein IAE80_27925 [Anaerolinea sp.]|nr:hypothetical protein [Anaerolinea sp.]